MKPKVLVLVDWFSPGFRAGGPIRSCVNLIQWLGNDFEFSVITSDRDWGATSAYNEVRANEWTSSPEGIRTYYATLSAFSKNNLRELIERENPDFLLLNGMYSRPFTQWPLQLFASGKNKFKILLAPRGMLRPGALSLKPIKKKIYLQWFRFSGWHKKIEFLSTADHESEDIVRVFGDVRIRVAPNLPTRAQEHSIPLNKNKNKAKFICIGRIAAVKNIAQTLRSFQQVTGEVTLDIYGPMNEPDYWKTCEPILGQLPANVKAKWKGELHPGEVRQTLAGYHFFILNSVSENFGHAIYEALAAGKPVLIGDQTPWRHLESHHAGWDLPVTNDKAFREQVQRCTEMDNETYREWSEGAASYALKFIEEGNMLEAARAVFSKR